MLCGWVCVRSANEGMPPFPPATPKKCCAECSAEFRWEPCSDVLHYTHTVGSMIPIHRELQEAGLRGLVLSGGCGHMFSVNPTV
jgi:hypothetical protein